MPLIKDEDNQVCTEPNEISAQFSKFHTKWYNGEGANRQRYQQLLNNTDLPILNLDLQQDLAEPVAVEEIKTATFK